MQIDEPDWLKSIIGAVFGGVSTAAAFVIRQDRRITKVEKEVEKFSGVQTALDKSIAKSAENGERLARVETSMDSVAHSFDRLEAKIDRILTRN